MKIIRQGDPLRHEKWIGNWSCTFCGCQWQMEAKDPAPKLQHGGQLDPSEYVMECPTCKRMCYKVKTPQLQDR